MLQMFMLLVLILLLLILLVLLVLMLFCHQDLVEQQQMGSNPDYGIPTPTLVSPPKVSKIEDLDNDIWDDTDEEEGPMGLLILARHCDKSHSANATFNVTSHVTSEATEKNAPARSAAWDRRAF